MSTASSQPLGPLFGPDFVVITVNDETGVSYPLNVFPDANNPALKAAGLPTQFYYLPQRIRLAKRPDAPAEYDLSVTLFKGLMTLEDTLGLSGIPSTGGEVDAGGAFVTFSTTMAVPDSVISSAIAKLAALDHPPAPPRIASFFLRGPGDPTPLLGIVPIIDSEVTIEVPPLPGGGDAKSPFFINAQGAGKGSIEASGISSFLITCNQMAAGAIVGALKTGHPPFTVHYLLKTLFYINACEVDVNVDVDKVFTQFSGAAQARLGFYEADLKANYQSCLTTGGVSTVIHQNGALIDPDMKSFIEKNVSDMQTRAWDLVKNEIFSWQPKPDDEAKASAGACGGAAVSLSFNYQKHGVHFNDHLTLDTTIAKDDRASGDLNELVPAITRRLDTYLSIVDIGEFFKKIQIAASPNIDFGDSPTSDPISAALVEISYPNFDKPTGDDGQPAFITRAEGFHYTPEHIDQTVPVALARWSADNPKDIINIAFLRLSDNIPGWDADKVRIRKTLVYKSDDPRVDLSNGGTTFVRETITNDHAPVIGPEEVGYIYIKFFLDRPIKTSNMTVTLTVSIGKRTDTLVLANDDPKQNPVATWQVWSDKYFNETMVKVKIDVEVAPPPSNLLGDAVNWSGVQAVPVNLGRIKRIVPCKIVLPTLSDPAQLALANGYLLQAMKDAQAK